MGKAPSYSLPTPRGLKAKPPRHRRRAPTRRRFGGHLRGRLRSPRLGRDKALGSGVVSPPRASAMARLTRPWGSARSQAKRSPGAFSGSLLTPARVVDGAPLVTPRRRGPPTSRTTAEDTRFRGHDSFGGYDRATPPRVSSIALPLSPPRKRGRSPSWPPEKRVSPKRASRYH